jgi:hypothetical protein
MKEMNEMDENEIIYSYTRKQAIADGVLIDVTELAKEAGFKCSVAFTNSVDERHVRVPEDIVDMDENRRNAFPVRVLISDSDRRQQRWNDLVTMPAIDMEIAVSRKDQAIVAQFAHSHQARIGY